MNNRQYNLYYMQGHSYFPIADPYYKRASDALKDRLKYTYVILTKIAKIEIYG